MEKAGVGGAREGENPESQPQSGPTQLHRLLELVREEQNIFNIAFHEIIRQVCHKLVQKVVWCLRTATGASAGGQ